MTHEATAPRDIWYHFFSDSFDGNEFVGCYNNNCKIHLSASESYVYACLFLSMRSGAINFNQDNIKFLHSSCFFENCFRDDYGGAIYFKGSSSVIQHRFCSINASSNGKDGCNSYIYLSANKENIISECSISQCLPQKGPGLNRLAYGKCGFYSSNVTKNRIGWASGFDVYYADGPTTLNFSTFEGNHVNGNACIYLHSNGYFFAYNCNIKNCTQYSKSYGIIHCNTQLTLQSCSIIGPYGNGTAFSANENINDIFYIYDCNIDPYSTYTGSYVTKGIIITKKFNLISHLSTYKCKVSFELDATKIKNYILINFYHVFNSSLHTMLCE